MRYKSPSASTSTVDDLAMPRLLSELSVNQFGTSAKYLSMLEQKSLFPLSEPHNIPLPSLRAIYSTGSPLAPSTFRYVYKAFGPDINLGSITGGTDIVSLFGAPNPLLPVVAGEVQAPGLGMALRAFTPNGKDITDSGEAGELVCVKPFPCQPVFFWPSGEEGEKKYKSSYFEQFQVDGSPVWHHGDYVAFNPRTGGIVMLGRSDGILNPSGVRFGSAEIYNVLLKRFSGIIGDSICIGRRREWKGEQDEVVCLFVEMEAGKESEWSADLANDIKKAIREALSPRHVPGVIEKCDDIPVTINGKK